MATPHNKYFSVRLKKSPSGAHKTHRATLAGLGLKHLGQTVVRKDTPQVRGMLYKVSHLITLGVAEGPAVSARARAQTASQA